MDRVASTLFEYLRRVIYDSANAKLTIEDLPEDFQDFGRGLKYFVDCVMEIKGLALALSRGELGSKPPSPGNEIASSLKSLQASLRHLTWQTQQIADGDYQQHVEFMGDFDTAFNSMIRQLEERRRISIREKTELEQYINMIISNSPDVILVFDTDGYAVLANEAYEQFSGKNSAEGIIGKTLPEVFSDEAHGELLKKMEVMFKETLFTEATVTMEHEIDFGLDGNSRTYLVKVTAMLSDEKTIKGVMVIFNDITEMIQARQDAEVAREQAEHSARVKIDFLARMSHEMRTPMNAVIGMTSIGKSTEDVARKNYAFEKIDIASTHLLGVINDILDMSKIEADKFVVSYSSFKLSSMIDNIKSLISFQVSVKEQEFTINVDESIPTFIVSDEQRLAQVITNLLSNAVKFTPMHGSVSLSVKRIAVMDGSCTLRFIVTDTGIGVAEDQIAHLFIPFAQADGSISRKYGGTGLGLPISKRIVELMGGDISVESELGKGSSFMFDIDVEEGADSEASDAKDEESIGTDFSGKRIMIAEDVDINREIISALLENTGVVITFAVDGAEAVKLFSAAPEENGLILMDIQMPGMDGYEATRLIRASGLPGAKTIPIIAMTANVMRDDIDRCFEAGMNDHLGKPVDIYEVLKKLGEYLR